MKQANNKRSKEESKAKQIYKVSAIQSEDIVNDDDAYEDYFEKQMEKDTMGIEEYEQ